MLRIVTIPQQSAQTCAAQHAAAQLFQSACCWHNRAGLACCLACLQRAAACLACRSLPKQAGCMLSAAAAYLACLQHAFSAQLLPLEAAACAAPTKSAETVQKNFKRSIKCTKKTRTCTEAAQRLRAASMQQQACSMQLYAVGMAACWHVPREKRAEETAQKKKKKKASRGPSRL